MGNLIASWSPKEDKLLEKHGATFIGSVGINEVEYHIWGHAMDSVPVLEELNILKEELQQAYARIDELQGELKRKDKKSAEDSWRGCVDRQGGAIDDTDLIDSWGN